MSVVANAAVTCCCDGELAYHRFARCFCEDPGTSPPVLFIQQGTIPPPSPGDVHVMISEGEGLCYFYQFDVLEATGPIESQVGALFDTCNDCCVAGECVGPCPDCPDTVLLTLSEINIVPGTACEDEEVFTVAPWCDASIAQPMVRDGTSGCRWKEDTANLGEASCPGLCTDSGPQIRVLDASIICLAEPLPSRWSLRMHVETRAPREDQSCVECAIAFETFPPHLDATGPCPTGISVVVPTGDPGSFGRLTVS